MRTDTMREWCGPFLLLGCALLAALSADLRAGSPAPPQDAAAAAAGAGPVTSPPRSARNANYSIDVELDPATRSLVGRQTLTWRNLTRSAASELRFHLYWNAWLNSESTWMREQALAGPGRIRLPTAHDEWGAMHLTAVRVLGTGSQPFADLTSLVAPVAPDDGNPADRTVVRVPLPRPVGPGESIAIEMAWTARVPRTVARTGHIGRQFYFLAHWYPMIGVLESGGWNAHQFHAGTEFFSDYGVYDVRITVPNGWVVGATGREQQRLAVPGGKTTHRYRQEDVHQFAWTTSPDFVERRERFVHRGLPPVEMRLLLQPEHASQAPRYFEATRATLQYYGQWFGPYPYGHVTIVDPAWQSGAGGMEYPTLFTGGTRWLAPQGTLTPESVTIHEAGHQFWYGLVGNNEFEHAWLDEGINTFATARVIELAFEPNYHAERFFGGFVPWVYRDIPLSRATDHGRLAGYRRAAESDRPDTPSWRYFPATGGHITYAKTALWLHTLEQYIGWPRLQRGLALFFARQTFGHPTPEDLFAALEEGAGTDLSWFFDQVYRTSYEVDYGVQQVSTAPVRLRGYRSPADTAAVAIAPGPGRELYRTDLVVRRYGEAVLPVEVAVTFGDGTTVRERWDGRERWKRYTWEHATPAVRAEVDPRRVLLLDVNYTNNSWLADPPRERAARKWGLHWMIWLQDALLTWAAFV